MLRLTIEGNYEIFGVHSGTGTFNRITYYKGLLIDDYILTTFIEEGMKIFAEPEPEKEVKQIDKKVLILGDPKVGKTALMLRWVMARNFEQEEIDANNGKIMKKQNLFKVDDYKNAKV